MYFPDRKSALKSALAIAGYDDVDASALDRWLAEFRRGEPVPGIKFHGAVYGFGFGGKPAYSFEASELRAFRALVTEVLQEHEALPPAASAPQEVRPAKHAR